MRNEEYRCGNCKYMKKEGKLSSTVCTRIVPVRTSPDNVYTYILVEGGVIYAELIVDDTHLCKLWEPMP